MKPEARRERLLLEEVGDELVVYDVQRHHAHQLNRAAALVWRCCDGRKTVADLKKVLQKELNPAADEAIVWRALDRLEKAHLLRETLPRSAGLTRRQALGKFGQTAALALLVPAVTSITAPAPLQADIHYLCNRRPCTSACKDECGADKDCSDDKPFCRMGTCTQGRCRGCPQMQCTSERSPHKKPHNLLGGSSPA